jgi:hypothetical protein
MVASVNAALVNDAAQQPALAPLHHHVNARALFAAVDAHHPWVVEFFADSRLALEAVGEQRVGLHVGVGNLERHNPVVAQIRGAKNGGHAASRNRCVDAIGIDLCAGLQAIEKAHRAARSVKVTSSTVSGSA